ncbi:MAG: SDR family NAD(P)-dependent oxidoreductase [Dehalococcoidia bacterium]
MTTSLDGRVVAMLCRGSGDDRAIAVALAEAGADIAIGTISGAQKEEFATASIANEVWAIGREQMNSVLDATDPTAAAAFAAEVADRLGRCDAVVIAPGPTPRVEFDELSKDEWDEFAAGGVTAPLVAAMAFSKVIERGGGGAVVFVVDGSAYGDVAGSVVGESLRAMAANMGIGWKDRSLRALSVSREGAPEQIVSALR